MIRLSYQANRPPTERDKESVAGQRAYLEAQKLGLEPDFGLAKERYTTAIEHFGHSGQKRLQAQAMRVYGSVLFDHDDYDGAVEQHQAALRIFESLHDHQELEIVLGITGSRGRSRIGCSGARAVHRDGFGNPCGRPRRCTRRGRLTHRFTALFEVQPGQNRGALFLDGIEAVGVEP